MRYRRFSISNYRAITGPIEIDIEKRSLTSIVGVNESGKTTILHAIHAFDRSNDDVNGGVHLDNYANLYRLDSPSPAVTATIEISKDDWKAALDSIDKGPLKPMDYLALNALQAKRGLPETLEITRDLRTRRYSINENFGGSDLQHEIAMAIVARLPFILYFDDFRDKLVDRVEITKTAKGAIAPGWPAIIQKLFRETDPAFSLANLADYEPRRLKSMLARVERKLNETVSRAWQSFRLDERDALTIKLDFEPETGEVAEAVGAGAPENTPSTSGTPAKGRPQSRHFITFHVVETDSNGDQHYFYISDRSKGFYWFFNFVMKLEFNPKVLRGATQTIYLLDEPGSYLHALAQRKLCQKLRQLAEHNCVIYCTHSHYLLDPETIPLANIQVADKDANGNVTLVSLTTYVPTAPKRSALQPVLDALQIKPFALDLITTKLTIVVEGIYDYFALELLRNNRPVSILPSVGADSIKIHISLLIAWQIEFRALWDHDDEGRRKHRQAIELFGLEVGNKSLKLLPLASGPNRIMQNLFAGSDLVTFRSELGISPESSYERTLHALFYSPRRAEILQKLSATTKQNFEELYSSLNLTASDL